MNSIDLSFEKVLPSEASTRQIIAIEQQAHGRTADIDRPLTIEQMADDTAALLRHIGIENADIFGYSMGAGIALPNKASFKKASQTHSIEARQRSTYTRYSERRKQCFLTSTSTSN